MRLDTSDPRWATNATRVANRDALIDVIETAFVDRTINELLTDLDAAGIPAGKVRSIDEVYEWEQTKSQGLLIDVDHSTLGTITLPGRRSDSSSRQVRRLQRRSTERRRFSVSTTTQSVNGWRNDPSECS